MVLKLPIGPKPIRPLGPPPPEPPEIDRTIEEWEKKATEHMELAQAGEQQLQQLAVEAEKLQRPPDWVPEWLHWKSGIGYAAWGPWSQKALVAKLRPQIEAAEAELERDDFYARLYAQAPIVIAGGRATDPEEILTLLAPPPGIPIDELDEVRNIVTKMVETLVEGRPPLPEMALEVEPPELPELVAPSDITGTPTSINKLTVAAIIKALTAPQVPPSVMTHDEWVDHLITSGQISDKADLDSVRFVEDEADAIVAEWQERNNMLEAFRAGIAEMPDYGLIELGKEMVIQPGLALLEIAGVYFEHVSMPLAGAVYKTFIPDIEAEYQRLKKTEGTWQALGHAWYEWDSPGDGAAEWILKYMLLEGLVDPITYVGWGLATRVTKPLGPLGRWVGATERGIAQVFEIPFDLMKYGIRKLPKTISQRALVAQNKAGQYVDKFLTNRYGKAVYQMTMKEWEDGAEYAIKYTLKHPHVDNVITRSGREFLKHKPVTEKEALDWAKRLDTTLTPEDITRQTLEAVDRTFEDFFSKVGGSKKLIVNQEASDELVRILHGGMAIDADMSRIAGKMLLERTRSILSSARSFSTSKNAYKAMQSLMKRNFRYHIAFEESAVFLARKEMGSVATLLDDVPIRIQRVWVNGIDKWVVRPFAESYLTFALYGPMNVIEDVIRTALGGVTPGRKSPQAFARKWAGTSYDRDLMRDAVSETYGYLRTRPSGELNNWILQLGGLAKGFGDNIYDFMVRRPGQIGVSMRRNFVDGRASQILKDLGGDTYLRLAKVGPEKLTGVTNKKIAKEVQQAATHLKVQGQPDGLRALKGDFTRAKIIRREVDNILKEHPDLPTSVRDYIMRSYDDGIMFREAGTSVDNVVRDANKVMVDDFIASPERASTQFEQLADMLTQLEVRNPQEMAQLMQSLNLMSSVYGATPKQILGRAVERTRGLPFAERRLSIDKALDSITVFRERAGVSMDKVVERIKVHTSTIYADNPNYISKAEHFFNLQTAKRIRGSELGEEISAWRHQFFAEADPKALHTNEFWDDFDREIIARHHAGNVEMADFDGMIKASIDDLNVAGGIPARQRPAIKAIDRELAPNDVAQLIGARGDDISRSLLDTLTAQNDRDMFTSYVMAHVKPDDVGFSKESVGRVYDQIVNSLQIPPARMSWLAGRQVELEAVRRDFHALYNSKMLPDEEIASIGKYLDNTATAVQDVMYSPPVGKKPPVLKEEFTGYNDLRQQAMDEAHKWYYKEFTDYSNANAFDAIMKSIYPFWCMPEHATILTRTGWKHHSELVIGEDVLTVNPETFVTSWEPVQDIAVFDYDDDLMVIPAKGKDIEFTPNHRWLVVDKLTGQYNHVKRGHQLTDGYDLIPRALPHEFPDKSVLDARDAAILGWCCTDGYINRGSKPHMIIYQSLHKHLLEIQELTGVSGRARAHTGYSTENSCDFSVRVANLDNDRILAICPDWSHLPELVTRLSEKSARAMWDAMFKGEGSTHIEYTGMENSCWKQKPGPVMDAFQILSILLGKAITVRDSRINILNNNKPYMGKECRRMFTRHYKGKVWCPVTPSGTWFVNCNGSIIPTGNTYESQRWFWLPRSFVRHPGTFTAFERWQNNTDYGYIHIPGTSADIGVGRGTIYGTLQTRLTRRDFPEYYDSLGAAGDVIEFSDFLSRYGFYPGAHIGVPLAIFGGVEMQFGEAMPAIVKTPLDALIGMYPESESVKWISERLFGDRFRNYMTILTVNRMGGDGTLIFSKQKENVALTEEEQQIWDDARQQVGWYAAGFEQFALFRFRTDEQYKMYEEASKVIEEMTGYTRDQQDWLRKHGYRLWDMVGGMSPTEQAILQEMDYYRWVGNIRPLLPGKQQEILNKIELGWNAVEKYGETVQENKLQLQRDFLAGTRGPDDYNKQLLDLYDKQGEFIDNKIEEYPLMDIDNRAEYYKKYNIPQPVLHPFRELLNLYFSIELKEIAEPETGEIVRDWDNFWAQRQAIEDAIPDDYKQEWEDFLAKNSTRLEGIRREVYHNYFRTYNKVWEKILSTYPENEQAMIEEYLHLERTGQKLDRQAEIKATKSEKTGDMLISSFRSEASGAKKALRYHNPQLDAWLYFWGKTSTFASPTGEEVYHELAKQTGRKI